MWSCPTAEPDSLMLRPQAQRRGQADRQKVPSGQYAHGTKIPILHTEDKLEGSLLAQGKTRSNTSVTVNPGFLAEVVMCLSWRHPGRS